MTDNDRVMTKRHAFENRFMTLTFRLTYVRGFERY